MKIVILTHLPFALLSIPGVVMYGLLPPINNEEPNRDSLGGDSVDDNSGDGSAEDDKEGDSADDEQTPVSTSTLRLATWSIRILSDGSREVPNWHISPQSSIDTILSLFRKYVRLSRNYARRGTDSTKCICASPFLHRLNQQIKPRLF